MKAIVLACICAGAAAWAGSASALTLTFDDIPTADPAPEIAVEQGVTIAGMPRSLGGGTIHLDDGGSFGPSRVTFSAGGRFDAVSLQVLGFPPQLFDMPEDGWSEVWLGYDNVLVEGFRGTARVALRRDMTVDETGTAWRTLTLGDAFRGIDLLAVSAPVPGFDDLPETAYCAQVPCGQFSIDNLVLEGTAAGAGTELATVPLPLGLPLLGAALSALGLAGLSRRRA